LEKATVVALSGVPETMLWTLYNRASEARRPGTFLPDPACVRIYESIAYDFERSFGKPDGTHPLRSQSLIEPSRRGWRLIRAGLWSSSLPAGDAVPALRRRSGAMVLRRRARGARRARALPAGDARCRYIAKSALDLTWMDEIDPSRGVCVTAQGLLMYLEPADVQRLVTAILERYPGGPAGL
jgi:O-methyltransferase involved in polyketide biosynthesis